MKDHLTEALARESSFLPEAQLTGKNPASAPVPYKGLYQSAGKRFLDITLVLSSLPIILPLILFLIIAVGRSPFYFQDRIGRGGKVFRLWKIRSMVPDADNVLSRYLEQTPAMRTEWDLHQKLRNDPRITSIGRLIRKTSLDELPQLWNVLMGDMSLVGPRPMMVEQKNLYTGDAYYRLRPGLTGSWQVSGRNNTTFQARASFDDAYENNLSLSKDISIMLKTFAIVVRATGK